MNFRRAFFLIAVVAAACRGTAPAAVRELDAAVPEWLATNHVPGAAVAVIRGRGVEIRTYGVADSESGAKVSADTVFEAASIGKVVFAYAVLRLVDRGRLDLDRPLQGYLPKPYIDDPRAGRITARMVLTHRSGLPNWRGTGKDLRLVREPDTAFAYSGEGFLFLQKVVEAITGEETEAFMRREVFVPLGMSHSSYIWLPGYDERKAWGHTAEGTHWRRRKPEGANVAATLQTTAADLSRFLIALMRGTGLSRASADAMLRTQSAVPETCAVCAELPYPTEVSRDVTWGLGVGLLESAGERYFWHWGDNGDFKAYFFGSRAARSAVVILTNGANGLRLAGGIARLALRQAEAGPATRPLQWLGYAPYSGATMLDQGSWRTARTVLSSASCVDEVPRVR